MVKQMAQPVDVISVCSMDGEIRPLRFRMEDEQRELFRVDIDEILSRREICFVGAESQIFMCSATVWGTKWLFELKYSIRSHSWTFLRKLH